jgi:SAM-dependent methyltransferase
VSESLPAMFGSERDEAAAELRRRLDAFYASTQTYDAFQRPNQLDDYWEPIRRDIESRVAKGQQVRALEFGAGCTGFRAYLGDLAPRITYHVQDVTDRHRAYLQTQADQLFFTDIREIRERYDVIFSTYVWEHITTPQQVLDHLLGLLNPGGTIFIASPRYDFPFYMSPSIRHEPKPRQLRVALWVALQRLRVLVGGRPRFLIHLDPAVLHVPWYRDADAIHWVSQWDITRHLRSRYHVRPVRLPIKGWRRQFWLRCLLLYLRIDDPRPIGAGERGA